MTVTQDLDILTLVINASVVVKVVLVLLLLVSFMSWMFIFQKWFSVRRANAQTDKFEREFWSGNDLNALGIDLAWLADARHVLFLVHELTARYHAPARLNDMLSVSAEVVKMGRASLVFRHRVEREAELLVEAEVTLALVDRDRMRPARMPEELKQAFK